MYDLLNILSLYLLAEFNLGRISHFTGYNSSAANVSPAFCVFAAHQVPATGSMPLNFAGSGYFNSFAQSFMTLLFRHLTISLIESIRYKASKKPFTADLFSA
jgi:hypothetical protein